MVKETLFAFDLNSIWSSLNLGNLLTKTPLSQTTYYLWSSNHQLALNQIDCEIKERENKKKIGFTMG